MDDNLYQIIRIQGLFLLLILSALFSVLEVSFLTVSKSKLKSLYDIGYQRAKIYLDYKDKPEELIQSILVGNNLVNIIAAVLSTVVFSKLLSDGGATVAAITASLGIIIFGEIIPKTFGSYRGEKVLFILSWFTSFVLFIFKPLSRLLGGFSMFFLRVFGFKKEDYPASISLEEVKAVMEMGEEHGSIEEEETKMIHGVFSLGQTYAYEVMVPRVDMVALEVNTDYAEALNTFVESGHTRLPIYEDTIDNIIGVVHSNDVLRNLVLKNEIKSIREIIREPYIIPETKRVDELLKELKELKLAMAIVVDEYGGIAGLVTIEDIVEEIVGDIKDEFDKEEPEIVPTGENQFIVQGKILLNDLEEQLGINFRVIMKSEDEEEEWQEEFNTLAGFIYAKLGRFPKVGEVLGNDILKIEVLEVKGRRIYKVKIYLSN